MKAMYKISPVVLLGFLVACGGKPELEKKKEELAKLKEEQQKTNVKIDSLQAQISRLDTTLKVEKTKLVSLTALSTGRFTHYIDLKGAIEAENVAYVTPRGQGGQVRAIYVKQGDNVRKGQLLMKLDDATVLQQIEQIKVQLSLAETTYERRKNLWAKSIGTEIELLKAQNDVDNLKKQIDIQKEQLDMTNVYAGINGVADQVNIKVGEFFTPASAAQAGIHIVNTSDLKVVVQVPENYLGRVGVGSNLLITLPELPQDTLREQVKVAGKLIDPNSRSFYVEAKLRTSGRSIRPNQLALVRIQDYTVPNTITIPLSTIQSDEKGKFVMVAAKEKNKMVARKKGVTVGELYGDRLEIKNGLDTGDQLITEGFQGLYDGQPITTDANTEAK